MVKSLTDSNLLQRTRCIHKGEEKKGPVVYWMSREQRVDDNWALIYAQELALQIKQPLCVVFCLTTSFLGANLRHYIFLLRGLEEVHADLARYNIAFHLLQDEPSKILPAFLQKVDAGILVTDFDPLRIKKTWKKHVARSINIATYEVDAHNIIPVWLASPKKEYAAYTIRKKINTALPEFLVEYPEIIVHPYPYTSEPLFDMEMVVDTIKDTSVAEISWCAPGPKAGYAAMRSFIRNGLGRYPDTRNNPCLDGQSNLSPYLHFGQLAPQRVALAVKAAHAPEDAKGVFLEELVVRRELADNFCYYEKDYDRFAGFHDWAKKTLNEHRNDKRAYLYSQQELENADSHDDLWNACQLDLMQRGKLHGYMRMYWAKKILEWTGSPEEAMESTIYLNDRYSIDGRDANGYAGIAWSIGGVHDRAWAERPVFGKIRYMNRNGCRRKFDVDGYIEKVPRSI